MKPSHANVMRILRAATHRTIGYREWVIDGTHTTIIRIPKDLPYYTSPRVRFTQGPQLSPWAVATFDVHAKKLVGHIKQVILMYLGNSGANQLG